MKKALFSGITLLVLVIVASAYLCLRQKSILHASQNGIDGEQFYVTSWGDKGNSDQILTAPRAIASGPDLCIYVTDVDTRRVIQYTADGKMINSWGQDGVGPGKFRAPSGIAVDKTGKVYVTDMANNCVQVFTAEGNFIQLWGSNDGSPSYSDDGFSTPIAIASSDDGSIFVLDSGSFSVKKFSPSGVFLTRFGSKGDHDGQFKSLCSITLDHAGKVFVLDNLNNSVVRFSSTGKFEKSWKTKNHACSIASDHIGNIVAKGSNSVFIYSADGAVIRKIMLLGKIGSVHTSITIDKQEYVYISCELAHSVTRYKPFAMN
ncbi:MAG TPA: 6-bladed beta-propeller [Armatimonadota bacterium]|nr:6-bladed beta-propeller [Armatimonadota bacterium]